MIPHTSDRTITIGGIDNATQFSIATTGKAFRVLIDNLYSDKILAPVRELITNAADAHAAAGNPDPFKVIVPTQLDPTFGVRDFGTGMDHDLVVGLYTMLFASSKDTSNEEAGMLGLGSKSPFAYTDTFTVETYDGSEKRVYMAYIQDDVPSLSLVGQMPSDEHRGVFVKFPVQVRDRHAFLDAIYQVIAGLDVLPELDGVDLDKDRIPQVIRQGNGWKLITAPDYHDRKPLVRMGGVLYPLREDILTDGGFPPARYGDYSRWVFDVPIGAADVTPSREALSYDEATVTNLTAAVSDAWVDLMKQVSSEYAACTSQYEVVQWASTLPTNVTETLNKASGFDGEALKARYDLYPGHFKAAVQWTKEEMEWAQKNPSLFPLRVKEKAIIGHIPSGDMDGLMFVLDDGASPRRRSRMLDWASTRGHRRFMIHAGPDQSKVVKRLQSLMHLSDDQFIPVADLPDPGPSRNSTTGGSKPRTLAELTEELNDGGTWAMRSRKTVTIRDKDGKTIDEEHLDYLQGELGSLIDTDEITFLTPKQVEKLTESGVVTWDNSLARLVDEAAEENLEAFERNRKEWDMRQLLEEQGCTHPRQLAEHLGFHYRDTPMPTIVRKRCYQLFQNRPNLVNIRTIALEAKKTYPALFPVKVADTDVADYLAMQDEDPTNEDTYA